MKLLLKSYEFYLALLGLVGALIISYITNKPPLPSSYVQAPSVAPFKNYIAASGLIEATDKNIQIGAPEAGIVEKLWHKVGDEVKQGEPLFQIDTRNLKAQLKEQEAKVIVEQANLDKSKLLLERLNYVKDPRAISKEDLEIRNSDVKIAQAKLEAAVADVDYTHALIDRLTVRAPLDGTILQQDVREGEYITTSKPQIILGQVGQLQVRAEIDELNAGSFNKDEAAVAFPKNNTSIEVPLTFVRIEPYVIPKRSLTGSPSERVDTRVLQVIYRLAPSTDYHLYVGQQMDVYIQKAVSKNG